MRVVLVGGGSRGDVQPVVALARGIAAVGHDVSVAASVDSRELVTSYGLRFAPLDISIADHMRGEAGRAWIADSAGRPFRELRHMSRAYAETAEPLANAMLTLSGTADVFVSSILSLDSVRSLAAHDGAGHVTALLSPFHPTSDGRAVMTTPRPGIRPLNLLSSRLGPWFLSRSVVLTGAILRRRLGMPETGPSGFLDALRTTTAALGASPVLVPPPPEWPATVTVTGPWTLPEPDGWTPPADLVAFLDDGPPPVYLGFGSLSVVQPERIRALATAAARRAGVRLVLHGTDLAGPDGDHPDVFGIGSVPHHWLLPRTAGVLHHGGAGTTHAALLAGVPQASIPHIADQPYWGRRTHEEGLGPAPVPLHRLTPDRLVDLLTTLASDRYRTRAADLGATARRDDGVTAAVAALGLLP